MSEATGGLQIVTTQASGWCDPDSGVCYIDTDDEAVTDETSAEEVTHQSGTGDAPDTTKQ